MRVLLVEDDQRLSRLMTKVLKEEHIDSVAVENGNDGLSAALQGGYDVCILDWMLPGRDGPSVARQLRKSGVSTPVLMLTARSQTEDLVAGLDSGADDYLAKPFSFDELLARLRALARRSPKLVPEQDEIRGGDIVLDLRTHTARRGARALDLSPTEWRLLELFLRHPGQALTRGQILDSVWPFDTDVLISNVDVYISYLRRKLRGASGNDPIETVRGTGYRFSPDA